MVALAASFAQARAFDLILGPAELERALTLARHPERERAEFHKRYVVQTRDETVHEVEVLTEFRRVVLAAEDHIRRGNHMYSARQAAGDLTDWHGKITIVLRLRFHPQNALVRVPEYLTTLGGSPVRPLDSRRTPLYALTGPGQRPGTATPLYGGLVETDFDAAAVGQARREVVVWLEGNEVTRAAIDFSGFE